MIVNDDEHIEHIAKTVLNIHSLVEQNSDAKDFHTIAVWKLRQALEQAYDKGVATGIQFCLEDPEV